MKYKNIILIGFMGCGKTSVGTKLARAFNYKFLDTDAIIEENYGAKIAAIFEAEGEEAFRKMETAVLVQLKNTVSNTVISTGGGLPLREENVKLLKEIGIIIFLKASKKTTIERLIGDTTRPLLAGEDLEEKVERLLKERMLRYEAAADYSIVTDNRSFYEIIKEIEKIIKS